MSSNATHLGKLNNLITKWADQGLPETRALHIYVKDSNLANYSHWASEIKAKYPNIKEVLISSIEKEFNL